MNVQYAIKDDVVYVIEVESARQPHGALCQQSDGRSPGKTGG